MAKRMTETTPKADGFRMPAEFEPQAGVWMLWPERPDNWRGGGKPAQRAFCAVAEAIARFEPVRQGGIQSELVFYLAAHDSGIKPQHFVGICDQCLVHLCAASGNIFGNSRF